MTPQTEYKLWRNAQFTTKEGFFPVFTSFKSKMKTLSPGAIALFLYFGINSNNQTGVSFHSIQTIANYFGKSPRTIGNWIKELVDKGLIVRRQEDVKGKQ